MSKNEIVVAWKCRRCHRELGEDQVLFISFGRYCKVCMRYGRTKEQIPVLDTNSGDRAYCNLVVDAALADEIEVTEAEE